MHCCYGNCIVAMVNCIVAMVNIVVIVMSYLMRKTIFVVCKHSLNGKFNS